MISFEQAKEIAERYLADARPAGDIPVILHDASVQEVADGWVFYYDSEQFIRTGEPKAALLGNVPLLVDRHTGHVRTLPFSLATCPAEEVEEKLAQRVLDTEEPKNGVP